MYLERKIQARMPRNIFPHKKVLEDGFTFVLEDNAAVPDGAEVIHDWPEGGLVGTPEYISHEKPNKRNFPTHDHNGSETRNGVPVTLVEKRMDF